MKDVFVRLMGDMGADVSGRPDVWVARHGSPRLKKAQLAGLLDACFRLYCEERVALELPQLLSAGWELARDAVEIVNPSEEALDMLLALRERMREHKAVRDRFGDTVELRRQRGQSAYSSTGVPISTGAGPVLYIEPLGIPLVWAVARGWPPGLR